MAWQWVRRRVPRQTTTYTTRQKELLREFERESSKDNQPESASFVATVRDFFGGGE